MARQPASSETVKLWIKDYPDLSFNGVELLCKVCNINLTYTRKTCVTHHVSSKRHQTLIGGVQQQRFNLDLVKFMVGRNIPWSQLENPVFKEFIENCVGGRYLEVRIPSSSSLRKSYLPTVADDIICYIRSELENKHIRVCVDAATNANGVRIANILVGCMEELYTTRGQLIASKVLETSNADSVCTIVCDSLKLLWGDGYENDKDKFLLFITNTEEHMKLAEQKLQGLYDFLHITCKANTMYQVAETVKKCYPKVDSLITSVRKGFLKAPDRTQLFYDILPNVDLPPEPMAPHWATWLEAARYYFLHLEDLKKVFQELDSNQSSAIASAQEAVKDPDVQSNLQEIHNTFSRIPLTLQQLEEISQSRTCSLVEQMNVIYDLRFYLSCLSGENAQLVRNSLETALESNPGYHTLSCIVKLLNKEEVDISLAKIHKRSVLKYELFRHAHVTCTDIERSFSLYKWVFSDRRRRLTPLHLEQILIIYFYYIYYRMTNINIIVWSLKWTAV